MLAVISHQAEAGSGQEEIVEVYGTGDVAALAENRRDIYRAPHGSLCGEL